VSALKSGEAGAYRFRIRSLDSPIRADDAVSRNEKRERRCAHGGGNAAMRPGTADRARNVGIRNELAEAKRCDCTPGCHLKRRPFEKEGQIEMVQAAREICSDLCARFNEQSVARFALGNTPACDEGALDDRRTVACDRQILTKWRAHEASQCAVRKQGNRVLVNQMVGGSREASSRSSNAINSHGLRRRLSHRCRATR